MWREMVSLLVPLLGWWVAEMRGVDCMDGWGLGRGLRLVE